MESRLNQQQVRFSRVRAFPFPPVREHTDCDTHSRQAHLPPNGELPCSLRGKSASQD